MFIVPAMKDNNQVSRGRGKGGLATIWSKRMTKYVSLIKCSNHRLQVTKFNFPDSPIIIFNVYFPCVPRVANFNDSELINLLADINTSINSANCNNVLIVGDFNCHFSRYTKFCNVIRDSLDDMGLLLLW